MSNANGHIAERWTKRLQTDCRHAFPTLWLSVSILTCNYQQPIR